MMTDNKDKEEKKIQKEKWWAYKTSSDDPLLFGCLAYFLILPIIMFTDVPEWISGWPRIFRIFFPLVIVVIGWVLYWFIFTIINLNRMFKGKDK